MFPVALRGRCVTVALIMYTPSQFEEVRPEVLHALIRAHPLGLLVTQGATLEANHIPFVLDVDDDGVATLRAHVPQANPVWQQLEGDKEALVVFQGTQAYVSPSWYPSKKAHGKVVPTWNYAVVHVRGIPRAIQEADWIAAQLHDLTTQMEASFDAPWAVADAPKEFTDNLVRRLVGIEIPIDEMAGKWKVSQNRSEADRRGVIDGLARLSTDDAQAMAAMIESGDE